MVGLLVASLIFYGFWQPSNLILLSASILFNYGIGILVSDDRRRTPMCRRLILIAGLGVNLTVLAYYKYAIFLVGVASDVSGYAFYASPIMLPLGISFFTFTQIAFLVDSYRGEVKEYNFIHYALFVTYFPHLIAGPILHHREIMPQFAKQPMRMLSTQNIAIGLTIFVIGLFKKVVFADSLVQYVDPVFADHNPSLIEAWAGALGYTLQIYFDFSGYSDMAIGLSRIFGIVLPLNFASPYKARSIIEFWRRWHMTLSRFLRDYLYFALGGNRRGIWRRYQNLMITMLLGGLWHGASWTFVAWGGLHGLYLVVNHLWRDLWDWRRDVLQTRSGGFWKRPLTFLCIVIAWVFFRANTFSDAWSILSGMAGLNGLAVPDTLNITVMHRDMADRFTEIRFLDTPYLADPWMYATIVGLLLVAWFAPATHEIMGRYRPALNAGLMMPDDFRFVWLWRPSPAMGLVTASLAVMAIVHLSRKSAFIYWNF
jgi:D-alanyl-lipoteichoic acid acyltransferase DltB (MBOAT superfamily)